MDLKSIARHIFTQVEFCASFCKLCKTTSVAKFFGGESVAKERELDHKGSVTLAAK